MISYYNLNWDSTGSNSIHTSLLRMTFRETVTNIFIICAIVPKIIKDLAIHCLFLSSSSSSMVKAGDGFNYVTSIITVCISLCKSFYQRNYKQMDCTIYLTNILTLCIFIIYFTYMVYIQAKQIKHITP